MTILVSLFALSERMPTGGFLVAARAEAIDGAETDPLFALEVPVDRERWSGIVIHDSGRPAGDPNSLHREHLALGHTGLGYHFVIGNGNGLGDGEIHVGYRWNEQQPGVHVFDEPGEFHNLHSIGICLVGSGDKRPFTPAQIDSLVRLTRRLQRELHIPADRVVRHSDLVDIASPGRYFPMARFQSQILP